MAYIGAEPQIGNYQICDAISVVNGQAAYTMQVSSTNVIPESANHMIVSLNGVIQKPGSSFTVSSSTITFASNLATGDSIDFIILLGNVLDLGVPSDSTVTTAKLGADAVTGAKIADDAIDSEHYTDGSIDTAHIADAQITTAKIADTNVTTAKIADDAITAAKINDDIISGATALTSEPADTDEFLVSDAGTLKRIDYSLIKGSGVAVSVVQDTTDYSQSNQGETVFGSGLSFTPASTTSQVVAFVEANIGIANDGSDNDARTRIKCGTDNSSGNTIFESSGTDNHGHVNMQASDHSMFNLHTFVISNCQRNSSNNVVVKLTANSNQDSGTTVYMYNMKAVFMEIG